MQSGQSQSAGILYERYKRVLWTYFYNTTKNTYKSEEMVQFTFEKVLKYNSSYQFEGTVKSWIFSIARNVIKEQWKKDRRLDSIDEIEETEIDTNLIGDDVLMKMERKELIRRAINLLKPEKRELLSMVKLQEMSYKEVAKLSGENVSTLKVRLFRIITELKEYMKDINARDHY